VHVRFRGGSSPMWGASGIFRKRVSHQLPGPVPVSIDREDAERLCIHDQVDRQAALAPAAIAVAAQDRSITYEELSARSSSFARYLMHAGVQRGDSVALSMRRSVDMVVAMLGILKAGAAYLPVYKASPVARKRKYLQDAAVTHIVADEDAAELGGAGRKIITTGGRASEYSAGSIASPLADRVCPEDRAYVMFTSGSTGEAKGVVVPHRAVTRLVVNTNYIQIAPNDKVLHLSPASFDASTFEIWGPLLNGATLVLSSAEEGVDPNALRRDVAERGVTIMWLTAALFHLIADKYIDAIRPLRILLAGGDVLSPRVVNRVLDAVPGITVINGYGPTENTTFTCCHAMTSSNRPPAAGVPIGRAISGTEVFILDEHLSPVRAGDVGELFAAGRGVALGYLHGDSSGSFFVNESICKGPIYRTGDLVRVNADHDLEFVGRKDNLVKVRGFRVSLDGIRSSILGICDVVEAAVFSRKEECGDQLLIAYVRTRDGSALDAAEIRRQLRSNLADYMIPNSIVLSEDLPITSNGKVDKGLLMSRTS
jgi:amino acid adenylation domain-containing protein